MSRSQSNVYVAIKEPEWGYRVMKARDYQTDAYNMFMAHPTSTPIPFLFSGRKYGLKGDLIFSMKPFDDTHLKGTYDSFCIFETENKEEYILSNEEEKLKYLTGFINRVCYLPM